MGCLEEAGTAVGAPGRTWSPAEATAATGENASPSREMGRETVIYSLILPFSFPPGLPTGPWERGDKAALEILLSESHWRDREAENASERKQANIPYAMSYTFQQS